MADVGKSEGELDAENQEKEEEDVEMDDDEDDDDEEDIYEVEKIVGMEQKKGKTLYRVRWAGYSPSWDTWEPYDNLLSCIDMIDEYVNQHKKDKSTPKADFSKEIFSPEESSDAEDSDKRSVSESTSSKGSRKKKPTYFYVSSEDDAADTLKDKFWRDLEEGKVNVFGNDMYSKVKGQGRVSRPASFKQGSGPSEASSTHSSPSGDHPVHKKRRKSSDTSSNKTGKKTHSQGKLKIPHKRHSVASLEDPSSDEGEVPQTSVKGTKKGKGRFRGKSKNQKEKKSNKQVKTTLSEDKSIDYAEDGADPLEKSSTGESTTAKTDDAPSNSQQSTEAVEIKANSPIASPTPQPSEDILEEKPETGREEDSEKVEDTSAEPTKCVSELTSPQSPDTADVKEEPPAQVPVRTTGHIQPDFPQEAVCPQPDVVAESAGASACGPEERCTTPPGGDPESTLESPAMGQTEWFSKDPKLLCCRVLVKHVSLPLSPGKLSVQSNKSNEVHVNDIDKMPSGDPPQSEEIAKVSLVTESPASPDEPVGELSAKHTDTDSDIHSGLTCTNNEISCDISAKSSDLEEVKAESQMTKTLNNSSSEKQVQAEGDGSLEKDFGPAAETAEDFKNQPSVNQGSSYSDIEKWHEKVDKEELNKQDIKSPDYSEFQVSSTWETNNNNRDEDNYIGPSCVDPDVADYPDPYTLQSPTDYNSPYMVSETNNDKVADYNSNEPSHIVDDIPSPITTQINKVGNEDSYLLLYKNRTEANVLSPAISTSSSTVTREVPSPTRVKSSMSLGDDVAFDFEFDIDPAPWDTQGLGRSVVDCLELSNSELKQSVRDNDYDRVRKALNSRKNYDLEQSDVTGVTLAMIAAQNGYDDVLELLVINGANVNTRQKNGATALMHACEQGHRCTVELLLMMGAYVNIQQLNGETALMKAVKRGNNHIVRLLLYYGANFAAQSNHNSALNLAKQLKNTTVIDVLSNHISQVTADFENQVNITLNNTAQIQCALFPIQCFALCESDKFHISFNHELQPTRPGVGMLLFIAHARITSTEIKCRFYGPCAVTSAVLNGVGLQPLTEESNFVLSFSPLHNGKNELEIHTVKAPTSRAKLVVCAYTAQLQLPVDST